MLANQAFEVMISLRRGATKQRQPPNAEALEYPIMMQPKYRVSRLTILPIALAFVLVKAVFRVLRLVPPRGVKIAIRE